MLIDVNNLSLLSSLCQDRGDPGEQGQTCSLWPGEGAGEEMW